MISNKYLMLKRRLAKLEKYFYEKTVGRGGEQSNVFVIWKYLMDNGPTTSHDIKWMFPADKRPSISSVLSNAIKDDCIRKQGLVLTANPDYEWDDVGVIQSGTNQYNNIVNNELNDNEVQTSTRQPRRSTARAVVPNLFSKNLNDVKAAVDAGQDVNMLDSSKQTPLLRAIAAKKLDIVDYLIENGADVNAKTKNGTSALLMAIDKFPEAIPSLCDAGADTTYRLRSDYPIAAALNRSVPEQYLVYLANDKLFDTPNGLGLSVVFTVAEEVRDNDVRKKLCEKATNYAISSFTDNTYWVPVYSVVNSMTHSDDTWWHDFFMKYKICVLPNSWTTERHLSDKMAEYLYKQIEIAANRNYQFVPPDYIVGTLNALSARLGKTGLINKIITPEFISKLNNEQKVKMIINCIKNNKADILKMFVNTKLSHNDISDIFYDIYDENISNEAAREFCKIVKNSSFKLNYQTYVVDKILLIKNQYIIDFFINQGFGKLISSYVIMHSDVNRISQEWRDSLEDEGYTLVAKNGAESTADLDKAHKYLVKQDAKHKLIKSLNPDEDNWVNVDRSLKSFPELLTDPEVIEAINDPANEHSYCVGQLKRRLAELPKDVYDF